MLIVFLLGDEEDYFRCPSMSFFALLFVSLLVHGCLVLRWWGTFFSTFFKQEALYTYSATCPSKKSHQYDKTSRYRFGKKKKKKETFLKEILERGAFAFASFRSAYTMFFEKKCVSLLNRSGVE